MKAIAIIVSWLMLLVPDVWGQCNLTYVGPAGGDWHTASNWNLCKVPDGNDIVTIPPGGHVNINNANATCRTITVQAGGTVTRNGTGTLTVTNSTGAVTCTAACFKRVFVTSTDHQGNLGGLAGADNICQTRASAASLGGTWRAWLSTNTVNASARIVSAEYRRIDNAVVASNLADLTDGTINVPISITEISTTASSFSSVHTGTRFTGTVVLQEINASCPSPGCNRHCNEWTCGTATCPPTSYSSGAAGTWGSPTLTDARWTQGSTISATPTAGSCASFRRLYCFEQ